MPHIVCGLVVLWSPAICDEAPPSQPLSGVGWQTDAGRVSPEGVLSHVWGRAVVTVTKAVSQA
jgi:hypothetical protein